MPSLEKASLIIVMMVLPSPRSLLNISTRNAKSSTLNPTDRSWIEELEATSGQLHLCLGTEAGLG